MNVARPFVALSLCVGFAASACTGDSAPARATTAAKGKSAAQNNVGAPPPPANLTVPSRVRGAGVPHSGNITSVVLSADGKAAVTQDNHGGVRLWPALDGSAAPLVVPAQGAIQLAVARRGREYLIAYVDSADAAHILSMTTGGKLKELLNTPPHQPVSQIALLPRGRGAVTLRKDRTFHLWTVSGTEVAIYEQRSFRPLRFILAHDGKSLVAVIHESDDAKALTRTVLLQRLSIVIRPKATLAKLGDERRLVIDRQVAVSVSPNGKRAAYLFRADKKKPTKWSARVADLTDPNSDPVTVKDELQRVAHAAIAFVNDKQVMVTGGPSARSWLIDLPTRKAYGRVGPPSHFASVAVPSAFGAGMRVAGLGGWLFVQNAVKGHHYYIGYSRFIPSSGAVSPNGKWTAWTSGGDVWFESLGKGPGRVARLELPRIRTAVKVRFVDDDHVLLVDSVGGLSIIEWASGKQLDTADASGPVARLDYSAKRRVVLVTRANNELWLFGIGKDNKFSGPHMLDYVTQRGGLLDTKTAAAPILWTRDLKGKYAALTWKQLTSAGPAPANEPVLPARRRRGKRASRARPDMDRDAREAPAPFLAGRAYDRFGFTYRLKLPASQVDPSLRLIEVRDHNNKVVRSITIDTASVSRLVPSPDASKLLVVERTGAVTAWDQRTAKRLWGFNFMRAVSNIRWSADGKYVVTATGQGAALLAADTGKQVYVTCGSWFERRTTPPPMQFGGSQQHLCAL